MTPQRALKAAIKAAGGTKTDLAKMLGVSPQAVQQWEVVPLRHVLRVEELFHISRHVLAPTVYTTEEKR